MRIDHETTLQGNGLGCERECARFKEEVNRIERMGVPRVIQFACTRDAGNICRIEASRVLDDKNFSPTTKA